MVFSIYGNFVRRSRNENSTPRPSLEHHHAIFVARPSEGRATKICKEFKDKVAQRRSRFFSLRDLEFAPNGQRSVVALSDRNGRATKIFRSTFQNR